MGFHKMRHYQPIVLMSYDKAALLFLHNEQEWGGPTIYWSLHKSGQRQQVAILLSVQFRDRRYLWPCPGAGTSPKFTCSFLW